MSPLTIPAEEKAVIDLEAGVYKATLKSVEDVDGQYGPQAKFVFELDGITQEDGSLATLWAWSSWKLNPATKLHRWALALGGERPVPGQAYNLDKLIDAQCRLLVETRTTEDGERVRVKEVMPAQRAGARTVKPTASEDTCSECGDPVTVYGPDNTPYCDVHAPQGA